jgi:hypothetical protein
LERGVLRGIVFFRISGGSFRLLSDKHTLAKDFRQSGPGESRDGLSGEVLWNGERGAEDYLFFFSL